MFEAEHLFILIFTDDSKSSENFDGLLYKKKICFVPFEGLFQSAFIVKMRHANYAKCSI